MPPAHGAHGVHDVIVIGLGGMGSAAADHLAARGARVLGLERFGPAHHQGSSHGGSRIVRQTYFEGTAYVPLLLRSYELFERLERATGRDLSLLCGGLVIGDPEGPMVRGSLRAAEDFGLPHELLTAGEVRRRYPTLTPGEDLAAVFEPRAGLVRPEETVTAQLERATAAGADLRFHEPVTGWAELPGGAGVRVTTAAGTYTAGHLVICPGAWAPRLLADLGLPLTVERQIMYWFEPEGGTGPYLPERHPVYLWDGADGPGGHDDRTLYGFPAIDGPGGGAKVAFYRQGEPTTADTVDRAVRPEEAAEIADHAAPRLPTLAGRLLRAVTCLYTSTPDDDFVIARHPAHASVSVACGFSGHGFKFVPVVGEILADLALTGATAHPIDLFSPARFAAS
ncbi:N-methyl-L-tryptophan oxidase [Streptomyces sp. SBT349]|uniref:N-methyl-L-tryptophan oxidase n=1 Tax=Streptomyces sp. SBT349 TaxID=1580539 RepID=UPI00066D2D52|nr:N-methyl-L-tryptophan oxidase [Streptomyces sp. SBT349]